MRTLRHIPVPVFAERKHGSVYLAGYACKACGVPCPASSFCIPRVTEASKRAVCSVILQPRKVVARLVSELVAMF